MSQFRKQAIGSLCSRVCSGGTPKSSVAEYYGGDIPWLNTKEVNFNRIYGTENSITQIGLDNSSAKWIRPNTVIVAMYGATAGRAAICKVPLTTNQACCNLEIDENKADYRFVYYAICNNYKRLALAANGGAQQNLNAQMVKAFEITVPPLSIQRKIAAILSSLDDKIENNNAICKNLEEQLKYLFDLRFRDMIDSRGMSQYTPLASLCERITKGTTPTTLGLPFVDEGINFIKAESITDKHIFDWHRFAKIGPDTHTALNRSQLSENDILFSIAGTLGRFALVDKTILPANTNQAVAIIRADKNKVEPEYLYSFFLAGWHHEYCQKMVQQAVQANLSLTTIKSMQIIMLDGPARREYVAQISPIMQMISQRQLENRALAILRDTLLPKLMSGEINVDTVCAH